MGVLEDVQAQYPSLVFLLGDPEIGPLLTQAVDQNIGYSEGTFQTKVMETNWWRSRTEAARRLEIERNTDPTTFNMRQQEYGDQVSQIAAELGVPLDYNQRLWLTTWGMGAGYDPKSQTIRNELVRLVETGAVLSGQGTTGAAKDQVEAIARGQWFTQPNWSSLVYEAKGIAAGTQTLESLNASLRSWTWNAYPHLREQLTEGQTMADIFNPYRQIIADELEMGSVEQVDMNNPVWRQILQWRDPTSNEMRMPTASEVQTLARSQDSWWKTSNGRKTDADLSSNLLRAFGRRA